MLYKKIHRQCLREWRVGRKFRICDYSKVIEITEKPHLKSDSIWVADWCLISLDDGSMWPKGVTEWLD